MACQDATRCVCVCVCVCVMCVRVQGMTDYLSRVHGCRALHGVLGGLSFIEGQMFHAVKQSLHP